MNFQCDKLSLEKSGWQKGEKKKRIMSARSIILSDFYCTNDRMYSFIKILLKLKNSLSCQFFLSQYYFIEQRVPLRTDYKRKVRKKRKEKKGKSHLYTHFRAGTFYLFHNIYLLYSA